MGRKNATPRLSTSFPVCSCTSVTSFYSLCTFTRPIWLAIAGRKSNRNTIPIEQTILQKCYLKIVLPILHTIFTFVFMVVLLYEIFWNLTNTVTRHDYRDYDGKIWNGSENVETFDSYSSSLLGEGSRSSSVTWSCVRHRWDNVSRY